MGYDYEITEQFRPCKHCGRSDLGRNRTLYTSYNHGWAFYEYLDEEKGLRWLYGKKGKDTVAELERVLECLEHLEGWSKNCETNPELGDGWNTKELVVGNAHYFTKHALQTAIDIPEGVWCGD